MNTLAEIFEALIDAEIAAQYGGGLTQEQIETYRTEWVQNIIKVTKTARA